MYIRSIFIFRQDLRLHDNTALIEAMKCSQEVFPIFIHDTRAIDDFGEEDPRFGFIRETLESIDQKLHIFQGRLTVYRGNPEVIIKELIKKYSLDAVFVNRSYNPRGKARDEQIINICEENGTSFHSYQDFLLVEPDEVEQRKVFTPFSLLWKKFILNHQERLVKKPFAGGNVKWFIPVDRKEIHEIINVPYHKYWTLSLGEERIDKDFSRYVDFRNIPGVDGSTRLSPYIRFGVYSIREIYEKVSGNPTLLSEIIWREFWYHIGYYFPFTQHLEFQEKKRGIMWNKNEESYEWQKFIRAETGYPLVDAAILQLYQTNWMHNRLRMVVASFLTKNLGFDWRIGERWFRKYLIDYDEAVNIGNWQWSASVGADPKPVRIFNPLLQSEKFDPDTKFIKKYIPALGDVDNEDIHTLNLSGKYFRPVVDQKQSAAEARERYKS